MNYILTLTAIVISLTVCAQVQLERTLLAAAGNQVNAANLRIEQSLGDLVVRSATAPGFALFQGFHQTYDFSTSVSESTSAELLAFPNPTRDHITIQWNGINKGFAQIQLLDLLGQVLWSGQASLAGPVDLDLSEHATGSYFIRVTPQDELAVVVRVQKVN